VSGGQIGGQALRLVLTDHVVVNRAALLFDLFLR
jgi:hypothetical protein